MVSKSLLFFSVFLIATANLTVSCRAVGEDNLDSTHFTVTFAEPVGMTIKDTVQNLLPFLDEAYDFLVQWTQFCPYSGSKIEISYDKTFFNDKPEKIIGWSGNPIHIKVFPEGNLKDDLYIYFHELTHDFTPPKLWTDLATTKSLTEGLADLGAVFLCSKLTGSLQDQSQALGDTYVGILRHYERNGSPFESVKWLEDHPDDEYPSDRLTAGILVAICRRYGWQIFQRFFVYSSETIGKSIFNNLSSFDSKMNFFVYLLSLSANSDLTILFRFWGFPLDVDSDGDGKTDGKEIAYGLSTPDFDQDGLDDDEEIELKTNPNNPDTDSDGLDDGKEVMVGSKPLKQDSDEDGVNDYNEVVIFETDPMTSDTDNDLWNDYLEVSIVQWTKENISFLLVIVRLMPNNWWFPNIIFVAIFLGLLLVIFLLRRR